MSFFRRFAGALLLSTLFTNLALADRGREVMPEPDPVPSPKTTSPVRPKLPRTKPPRKALGFDNFFVNSGESKWQGRIKERIAELDARASVNLFSLSLGEAAAISVRYRYAVEPGFTHDFHSRVDTWQVKAAVQVGDYIKNAVDDNLPVYFNMDKNAEVTFLRQLKSKKEALKAPPYTLKQLPITSDRALKYLNVGEMASMPARTNIVLGPRAAASLDYLKAEVVPIAGILRGQFTLQVFRAEENKIRLRIFANAASGSFSEARADLDLEAFGLADIESLADQIFPLNLVTYRKGRDSGRVLLFDFAFDTTSSEARAAFDSAMRASFEFKDSQLLARYMSHGKIDPSMSMFSNLKPAEDLAAADVDSLSPRVERLTVVDNRYSRTSSVQRYGVLVASWRTERNYVENFISIADKHNRLNHFFNPSFVTIKSSERGLRPIGAYNELRRTYFALLDTNREATEMRFGHLGFIYDRREARFNPQEQQVLRTMVRAHLPSELYNLIDWQDWGWGEGRIPATDKMAARVYLQFLVKASALPLLKRSSKSDFFAQVRPRVEAALGGKTKRENLDKVAQYIVDRAYRAVNDPKLSEQDRVAELLELRRDDLFADIGLSFLTGLLTAQELVDHAYLDFQMFAENGRQVAFTFGNPDASDVYRVVRDIDQVLNDRSLDPRSFERQQGDDSLR